MPRIDPRWEDSRTVAGFVTGVANGNLMAFARAVHARAPGGRCLDIGCGAARNAIPLADLGFRVAASDLSAPMLDAALTRIGAAGRRVAVGLVRSPMAPLPFRDATFDLVVAHGIWNLARSSGEFRAAVAEAARVARPGAGLFLFTFSRQTLPPDAEPDAGETFVFSSWHAVANTVRGGVAERRLDLASTKTPAREGHGEPQCFLTEAEILVELGRAGFRRAVPGPLAEYGVPAPGMHRKGGAPATFEGTFVLGPPSDAGLPSAAPAAHRVITRIRGPGAA